MTSASKSARIRLGKGENPKQWKKVSKKIQKPVKNNVLGELDAQLFRSSKVWTIRLTVTHKNGTKREVRFVMKLG